MLPPDASVPVIRQFERSPLVLQSHVQGCEWGPPSETRVAPRFILLSPLMQEQEGLQFPGGPGLHSYHSTPYIPNSRWSGPHFPDTHYSTPVDQVNFDPVGAEDDLFAFFEFDPSFVSNLDSAFTSLDPTEDGIQWPSGPEYGLALVFAENHEAVDNVLQASDEVPGYSTLSTFFPLPTSLATTLDPNILSSSQDLEATFQTTDPCASPSVDISAPDWGSGRPVVLFLAENSSIPNISDPAAGIYRSSHPAERSQKVDYEAVQSSSYTDGPPSEPQAILFEGLVGLCEWQNEDGTVCFEELTLASLPGHLSKHGISKKSRVWPTKCSWVGCRRKKSMNRESIVRHIREVHLHQKRSTKRTQDPYFRGAGLPPG